MSQLPCCPPTLSLIGKKWIRFSLGCKNILQKMIIPVTDGLLKEVKCFGSYPRNSLGN